MAPKNILPDAKTFKEMKDKYTWGDTIGSGSYGVVMRGFDRERNRTVAVKRIKTKDIGPLGESPCSSRCALQTRHHRKVTAVEKLRNEVNILNLLYRHPNVMELVEQFESPYYAFLILEVRLMVKSYDDH